jgi:hypothetical protein
MSESPVWLAAANTVLVYFVTGALVIWFTPRGKSLTE